MKINSSSIIQANVNHYKSSFKFLYYYWQDNEIKTRIKLFYFPLYIVDILFNCWCKINIPGLHRGRSSVFDFVEQNMFFQQLQH